MATWITDADLLAMLTGCGGESVTVYSGDFGSSTYGSDAFGGALPGFTAVLDREFVEVQGIEGENPVLTCRTSDVPGLNHGDSLTVNSTGYTVRGIQHDGNGLTVIVLEES